MMEELEGSPPIRVLIDVGGEGIHTYCGTLVRRGTYGLAMITDDHRVMFFPWGHLISVEMINEEKE